jgi:hypothetical protein
VMIHHCIGDDCTPPATRAFSIDYNYPTKNGKHSHDFHQSASLHRSGYQPTTERLMAILQALWPGFLADQKKNPAGELDLHADRPRRVILHIFAFGFAYLTAGIVAGDFGSIGIDAHKFPVPIIALLAMGGSAFWKNIIEYTSAAKDIKSTQRAAAGLEFHETAVRMGKKPQDAGTASRLSTDKE